MGRIFEKVCIVMLGLGQMGIMTGFDTQSFVQESVIHSVNEREPWRIDKFAGYYGQAVCYFGYMFFCLIGPSVMHYIGAKNTLLLGSICFTFYQVGFFFLNNVYYYTSCVLMGAGFAFYYTGNGGYLTSHSTRKTVEENSAIIWSIGSTCMLAGSGILALVFSLHKDPAVMGNLLNSNATELNTTMVDSHDKNYRRFSGDEIFYMYAAFSAISILANVIFALIPKAEIENCIESENKRASIGFKQQMSLLFSTFTDRSMLLLTPCFLHLGLYSSFWVAVYPTSLVFTKSLSHNIYLPAMYSFALGAGEIAMGCIITFCSRRIKDFGLKPTICIGFILSLMTLAAMTATIPEWSTVRPTDEPAWFIQPTVWIALTIAFVIGLADSCMINARTVICAIAIPHRRNQVFAVSKFYQAGSGAVMMFVSPYMTIYHYVILLTTSLCLSVSFYLKVASATQKREKEDQTTVEYENPSKCSEE